MRIPRLIDAGSVTFLLSGYFARLGELGDNAKLTVSFLDDLDQRLDDAMIGGFGTNAVFDFDSDFGAVPMGTRSVEVELTPVIVGTGTDNDGFADALNLEIIPEPSTALLVGLGLIGIAANRQRARPA